EVSIGHALTAEALEMGFTNTVKEYLKILAGDLFISKCGKRRSMLI
ncbi:MAG: pyridoxine 5'-phosphate synthase, partial [Cyanobacteria bacterium J06598_4]